MNIVQQKKQGTYCNGTDAMCKRFRQSVPLRCNTQLRCPTQDAEVDDSIWHWTNDIIWHQWLMILNPRTQWAHSFVEQHPPLTHRRNLTSRELQPTGCLPTELIQNHLTQKLIPTGYPTWCRRWVKWWADITSNLPCIPTWHVLVVARRLPCIPTWHVLVFHNGNAQLITLNV